MTTSTCSDLTALLAVKLGLPIGYVGRTVRVLKRAHLFDQDTAGRGGVGRVPVTSRSAVRLLLALLGTSIPARSAMAVQSLGALRPFQTTWRWPGDEPGSWRTGNVLPENLPGSLGFLRRCLPLEETLVSAVDVMRVNGGVGYPQLQLLIYRTPTGFASIGGLFNPKVYPVHGALLYGTPPRDGTLHVVAVCDGSILMAVATLLNGSGESIQLPASAVVDFPTPALRAFS
jgi:hypothetical protein